MEVLPKLRGQSRSKKEGKPMEAVLALIAPRPAEAAMSLVVAAAMPLLERL